MKTIRIKSIFGNYGKIDDDVCRQFSQAKQPQIEKPQLEIYCNNFFIAGMIRIFCPLLYSQLLVPATACTLPLTRNTVDIGIKLPP